MVGFPGEAQSLPYRVVDEQKFLEVYIGFKDSLGETSLPQKVIQQIPLDFTEGFLEVGRASCDRDALAIQVL